LRLLNILFLKKALKTTETNAFLRVEGKFLTLY